MGWQWDGRYEGHCWKVAAFKRSIEIVYASAADAMWAWDTLGAPAGVLLQAIAAAYYACLAPSSWAAQRACLEIQVRGSSPPPLPLSLSLSRSMLALTLAENRNPD